MSHLNIALRAVLFGSGFVVVWVRAALGVRSYDRTLGITLPFWLEGIGIMLILAGGTLSTLCVVVFVRRGKGTPAPFDAPRIFVATGPYRYMRNPMYLGGWIALVGFSFYQRSVSILLLSIIWILFAHFFVLGVEEPGLEKRFGCPPK